MNCLLVPTLAMDLSLLDRLAASIDHPIAHKVVINNGRILALHDWGLRHPDWTVMDSGSNLGVAASWNMAPKIWPNELCYLIVNDDVAFHPGALREICRVSDLGTPHVPFLHMTSESGYMAFVWTKRAVNMLGTFDENFWPAYYEDSDMRLRLIISNQEPHYIFSHLPLIHQKPPCGGNFTNLIKGTEVFNREYYIRKWNRTDHCGPHYPWPFNNPSNPTSYWALEKQRRQDMLPLWNTFLSIPDASIYT